MASDPAAASTAPATYAEPTREELIKELWPDKALYAAVLLFISGFVGVLTGVIQLFVGLSYASAVPPIIQEWPPAIAIALAGLAVVVAYYALLKRSTAWTLRGCLLAILSVGFLGVNSILAFIAVAFAVRSRLEGEDENPATKALTAEMWPDKTLAASLLLLIGGVLTLVWGAAIALDLVTFDGYIGPAWLFGWATVVVGIVGLAASRGLYFQQGPMFAMVACILTALAVGLWVIGPALAFGAFILTLLGLREHEFEDVATS